MARKATRGRRKRPGRILRKNRAGWAPIGYEVAELLRAGKISTRDAGIYTRLKLEANYATGRWTGTLAELASGESEKTVVRCLESLECAKLVRVFWLGKKRYVVLVHGFDVTVGPQVGHRLDAWASGGHDDGELVYRPSPVRRRRDGTGRQRRRAPDEQMDDILGRQPISDPRR